MLLISLVCENDIINNYGAKILKDKAIDEFVCLNSSFTKFIILIA